MFLDEELETKEKHDALFRLKEKIKELKPKPNEEKEKAQDKDDKNKKLDLDKSESELWSEYYKIKPQFGTMAMITNKNEEEELNKDDKRFECSAEKIYHSYKTRDQVEKIYDVLNNVTAADVSYMQNASVYKGWMFCNFMALIWYYRLKQKIDDVKMGSLYSLQDILKELNYHQIVKCNGKWTTVERDNKEQDILNKLGIIVAYDS